MNRRELIKLGAAAGAAFAATPAAAWTSPRTASPPRRRESSVPGHDGTRLFVRDWGDGPPILFLSGWALTSDMWAYQMLDLEERGYRCIAFDRRGHGRSDDPGGGYDYASLANDLASVMSRLDLRGVTLIGHSMAAGEIARYLATHGRARVERVLFLAPITPFLLRTADNPAGMPMSVFQQLRAAMTSDFPKWISDNAPPFFVPGTSPETIEWVKRQMLQTSMQAVIECQRALTETDFRGDLKRMNVPTLVIHGDKDASAPLALTGKRTAQLVPGARLSVYEGAPHGLFVTHKQRLNADILRFVTSSTEARAHR